MRPEAIRNFLIRSASVIEKTDGVISKDAALVNPELTPTAVTVATSLIQAPVTEEEELKFGQHVDSVITWYHGYTGNNDFVNSIREQVTGTVKTNANILVWALPVYEGELRRTKRISDLKNKILCAIDVTESARPIDGNISGRCGVIDVVNSQYGSRIYHLVDLDTKRYMKYSAYGKTQLNMESKYSYTAKVRDHCPDNYLDGNYVTKLANPRFTPVLI